MTACLWDPTFGGAAVILSNGNKTAAINQTQSIRGTVGYNDVKRWFELLYSATVSPQVLLGGIADAVFSFTTFLGADVHGWGYYQPDGSMYHANVGAPYGAPYAAPITLGIGFDPIAGTILVEQAGVSQGLYTNAALIGATMFPAIGAGSSSGNRATVTLRCSQADIVNPIPSGYIAWDSSVGGAAGNFFACM